MADNIGIRTSNIADLRGILEEHGVAILEGYFGDKYADKVFNSMVNWMVGLGIGLTTDTKTWTYANTPLGPRYGMYQSIVSNAPIFWELREKFYLIFSQVLGETELLTSVDGASIFPTIHSPRGKPDWAHIDQTVSSDFMCYQAQFVAADTAASFVCTPGSHTRHKHLIKKFGIHNSNNWYKFSEEDVAKLKKIFGQLYQIPIHAAKGSVIFWDSRTIHSAKYPDEQENKWRAVLYISMRPKTTFTRENISTIQQAVRTGCTTDHWGLKIFKPFDRFNQKNSRVTELVANCSKLSTYTQLNSLQRKLCGFDNYEIKNNLREECLFIVKLCLDDGLDPKYREGLESLIRKTDECNLRKLLLMLSKLYCDHDKIIMLVDNKRKNIKKVIEV